MERLLDAATYYEENSDYRKILDAIDNPIVIINMDMEIVFMNLAQERIADGTREDYIGKHCSSFGTPSCGTEFCCIKRGMRGETAIQNTRDGFCYRVFVSVLHNKEGNPCGYISISTDITELVQAKKSLESSEEQYRNALLKTRNSIWEFDVREKTMKALGQLSGLETSLFEDRAVIQDVPESLIRDKIVHEESVDTLWSLHRDVLTGVVKPEYLLRLKNRKSDGRYCWIGITISLVFDKQGKVLKAIGVSRDVTKEQEILIRYQEEHEYRELLMKDAVSSYDINLTQNRILNVVKGIPGVYLGKVGEPYTQLVEAMMNHYVDESFRERVRAVKNIDSLLERYQKGEKVVFCEYPLLINQEKKHWVESYSYLKETEEGDICAFVCIKDIDKRKREELELKKAAQMDQMTGLLNRAAFRTMVSRILETGEDAPHGFAIIDIDNFKQINDTFGHLYGDAVLSEIGFKIKQAFRKTDIVGRLGGDEFAVFFKQMSDEAAAMERIEKLRKKVQTEYVADGMKILMSVSIGIAFAPRHGSAFEILYEHADKALYYAKNEGKDASYIFSRKMETAGARNQQTEIRQVSPLRKNFQDNVPEYVFKILYHSNDLGIALESVLQLIGRHFNMQRSYIIEYNPTTGQYDMTWEWHDEGVSPSQESDRHYTWEQMEEHRRHFGETGIFLAEDTAHLDEVLQPYARRNGSKSFFHFALMENQKFKGLVGMDYTQEARWLNLPDVTMLGTVVEIIGTFLLTRRSEAQKERYIKSLHDTLNLKSSAIYIINPDTYEVVSYNKKTEDIFPDIQKGDICYRHFRDKTKPCDDCPIRFLLEGEEEKTVELYNEVKKDWLSTTVKWVDWMEYGRCAAVENVTITKYKKLS